MSKCKNILYLCDILGLHPKLRIFNKDSYKSTYGAILSIIVIFLGLSFTVYSLIVYFNYANPSIVYSKDNDKSTSRSILLSDALLLFGLYENTHFSVIDKNNAFIEGEYIINFNNGSEYKEDLIFEYCEYGENIDKKHQEYLNSYAISEYHCISKKQANYPLFYLPDIGKTSLSLSIKLGENSIYSANDIILYIINGNDVIDHSNKDNPISNNYFTSIYTSFSSEKFNIINYYLQFIKYESDDGFLFPNNKIFNAKAYSQMTIMETNYVDIIDRSQVGRIFIGLSEINFDSYKRVYPRIQSLIAEITSMVNLLIVIGEILTKILLEKKMNKDIYKFIREKNFPKKAIELTSENKEIISKNNNLRVSNEIEKSNKSNQNSIDILSNKKDGINYNKDNDNDNIDKSNNINIINNMNYFDIIKSFFCCKNEKAKLINYYNDFISKEICLENILQKLNRLQNIFDMMNLEDDPNNEDKK